MAAGESAPTDRWPVFAATTALLCWLLGLGGLAVAATSGSRALDRPDVSWPDLAVALAYPAVVVVVAHVRPARRWSALTLAAALASALNVAASAWAERYYVAHRQPTPGAAWAAWVADWSWVISIMGFVAIAYFPDDRLPGRRWRLAPLAVLLGGGSIVVGNALAPRLDEYGIANPLPGPHATAPAAAGTAAILLALGGLVGCLAAVVVKFRRSDGIRRRQIGWYAYGYAVTLVAVVVAVATDLPSAVLAIGPLAVAVGAGVAILRYRLYDLDRVVHRTLAWGLLTGVVVGLYLVCVGFFQRLFAGGDTVGGLLAAGIVALAFQPLRAGVQRAVNQLVYGYRDQPDVVLRELAGALDSAGGPEGALASLAGTLARSLRLPLVVLDVEGEPDFRAVYSGPAGADTDPAGGLVEAATARTGGTRVRVLVRPRGPGAVAGRDRQLLGDLAPSLAAAAEAVRLRLALDSARARAIGTLAEEQRRMRRDLHDGLGPVLAGLRLTIGTARRVLGTDPTGADRMLADAQQDAQQAIEDVRRLAHDLRPPALDELGLVEALRDRLERLVEPVCALEYTAVGVVHPLPAAVEVAVYRIGTEAVLNAVRHARPTRCVVGLRGLPDGLEIQVADDGCGMDGAPGAGVGVRAMRERAEELAGTIDIASRPGLGTTVRVWLPVTDSGPAGSGGPPIRIVTTAEGSRP